METKPAIWIGSSLADIRQCPDDVKDIFGHSLWIAQNGGAHIDAKAMKGLGGGVFELIADDRSGTYRAVYTVKFAKAVYVIHVFQKKSKSGKATPPKDIALIKARLKAAKVDYAKRFPDE